MSRGLYRRALMLFGVGKITGTDDGTASQISQVNFNPIETRDKLTVLYHYGFTANPLPGADAAVLFLGGDRTDGVVLATGDQRYRMRGLAQGEVAVHDNQGRSIYLSGSGIRIDGGGANVTITNTPTLAVEADIHCTKTITADVDVIANSVSLFGHPHKGVQPGDGESGLPIATSTPAVDDGTA